MSTMTGEMRSAFGERYRIERELGRGGMATVFAAMDSNVGRRVAIKVLHPELAAAVGAERFHREIRFASTLTHPNIVPVYDSGEIDGDLFYVMPLVEGESLRVRLTRDRQLSVEDTIRITCEIASALDYIHSQGVVHRDIKPENILLEAGHAVVADFGIARVTNEAAEAQHLTQTGMSLGTPAYMSPEQGLGERITDGRSDQYSLACVTYEMLAGEPPFTAPTTQALVARHINTPAPLISTVRPSVPDELEDVILRALEKVPADRFPTIGEYAAALDACGAMLGTSARRIPSMRATSASRVIRSERDRRRRTTGIRIAAATAVVLVFGSGTAAWQWTRHAHANAASGSVNARRVAVVYFQDLSKDQHLAHVADGLTEGLIERLRDVQSLDVVSRNGVAPLRHRAIPPDSIGRLLKVGTLVTGTVEPSGEGVHVSLSLLDGATGAVFRRESFTVPQSALLTATDSVAEETSRMLRIWSGEEVRLKEQRESARDGRAWSLLQLAERLRKEGEARGEADSAAAIRAFDSADSLLASAEARDSAWVQPPVLRARIALRRERLDRSPSSAARWVDVGLQHAERALKVNPRNADALELRGSLKYERHARNMSPDPEEGKRLVREAEADLLKATEINHAQANAWNMLSLLDYRKEPSDLAGSNIHARRALEEDAYLAAADDVTWRLFATSYDLGQHDEAVKWCDNGHLRFPTQVRFVMCELYLGVMKEHKLDLNRTWREVRDFAAMTPAARRPLAERQGRMLAAIPLAYAGQADSARHLLDGARADKTVDPDGSLLTLEALAQVRLGDRKAAIRLIKLFLSDHPQHRAGYKRNTWWYKDLESDPEFKTLVGESR